MNHNLIILAGGVSSRMRRGAEQATGIDHDLRRQAMERPKSLINAGPGGRPLMDYLLFNAREAGYRDIVIVVGEQSAPFREYYGAADRGNEFFGLTISYAVQRIPAGRIKPLGTADAVLQALVARPDWRGSHFTVCNSDNLYSQQAFRLLMASSEPGALIDYDREALRFPAERIAAFAVLMKTPEGFVSDIIEKPDDRQLAAAVDARGRVGVSMNIFQFLYDAIYPILETVPMNPVRQEKEIPTAVRMMIAANPRAVRALPLAEYVPDLTHPDDIPAVRDYLLREFPAFTLEKR